MHEPFAQRVDGAGGTQRQRRMVVLTAGRFAERLRRAARPPRGRVPARTDRRHRAGRTAIPAGDHGPRDELGHGNRVADRTRPVAHRSLAPREGAVEDAPTRADGLRRGPRTSAHRSMRER